MAEECESRCPQESHGGGGAVLPHGGVVVAGTGTTTEAAEGQGQLENVSENRPSLLSRWNC